MTSGLALHGFIICAYFVLFCGSLLQLRGYLDQNDSYRKMETIDCLWNYLAIHGSGNLCEYCHVRG